MKSNKIFSMALSVFVSFVFIFAVTFAATTISTNINTGGTLTVSDTSTLTGAVTMSSTLGVTGLTTLVNASSTMLTVSGGAYLATTTLTGGNSLILGTRTTDPSGQTEGSVYYNSGSKVIKLYDGSNWFTVGTTTSGLTLSGQRLQLADLNYYTTFGTTTQSGLSMLTLEATSTASLPLTLRGFTGQTADLFRLHNSSGTELFALDASGNASTTMISTTGNLWVGGNATTTSAGAFSINGLATLLGGATTTTLTLLNGETITNATDGTITLTAATTTLVGTASTSAIKIGDEPNAPIINGLVFGYCSFGDVTSFTASTTKYADCTTTPAGALVAGDRVFVQATSSLDSMFVITAASTTGVSTINLRILNTGLDGVADATLGGTSINFWAVR